jgi:hypothetical protein
MKPEEVIRQVEQAAWLDALTFIRILMEHESPERVKELLNMIKHD